MSHTAKTPVTPAIRVLREAGVSYKEHLYAYVEKGGTASTSAALGVDEHEVVKTLVFEDDADRPFIVLMHGDRNVSTKELARQLGVKRTAPCAPEKAQKHSGYMVDGTSPFSTRTRLPVYVERSVLSLPRIFINGGHRGFILEMSVQDLCRVVSPTPVDVAVMPGA
mgnify:FL=1